MAFFEPVPAEQQRQREQDHRLTARMIVLLALVVPMSIIPLWLMVLISAPVFHKEANFPKEMQVAALTAIATDFAGLYFVITRDLFPQGQPPEKPLRRSVKACSAKKEAEAEGEED